MQDRPAVRPTEQTDQRSVLQNSTRMYVYRKEKQNCQNIVLPIAVLHTLQLSLIQEVLMAEWRYSCASLISYVIVQ